MKEKALRMGADGTGVRKRLVSMVAGGTGDERIL
jgi:hypothetical protein